MGSTGYYGMTAKQAKERERAGSEVVHSSGNWYICRGVTGALFALHMIVKRYGTELSVKCVSVDMGPYEVPPQAFYLRWGREVALDGNYEIGEYEAAWRERCEARYRQDEKSAGIKDGDVVHFDPPLDYNAFGRVHTVTMADRKRRIAREPGGRLVRLPVDWKARVTHAPIGSAAP